MKKILRITAQTSTNKLFRLLNDYKIVRVSILDINAIGHNVGDFINTLIYRLNNNENYPHIIIYADKIISNKFLPEWYRRIAKLSENTRVIKIPDRALTILQKIFEFTNYPLTSENSGCSGVFTKPSLAKEIELVSREYFRSLSLDYQHEDMIRKIANRPICLVLTRDASYRGADSLRDTDIEQVIPTIDALTKIGYSVVRISKSARDLISVKLNNPNFFELCGTDYSDELFLRIQTHATFAISSWFGPMETLRILNIPTFFVNAPISPREYPIRDSVQILPMRLVRGNGYFKPSEIMNLLEQNYNLRSREDLSELNLEVELRNPNDILNSVLAFEKSGLNINHSNCEKCYEFKSEMFLSDPARNVGVGATKYKALLSASDFQRANFCIEL